jgi:hypothetical protein
MLNTVFFGIPAGALQLLIADCRMLIAVYFYL